MLINAITHRLQRKLFMEVLLNEDCVNQTHQCRRTALRHVVRDDVACRHSRCRVSSLSLSSPSSNDSYARAVGPPVESCSNPAAGQWGGTLTQQGLQPAPPVEVGRR